ncbi:MAG: hypothetical protein Q8O46_03680, partial [bacterium]|nr:hypothetical protein [bacterium]
YSTFAVSIKLSEVVLQKINQNFHITDTVNVLNKLSLTDLLDSHCEPEGRGNLIKAMTFHLCRSLYNQNVKNFKKKGGQNYFS